MFVLEDKANPFFFGRNASISQKTLTRSFINSWISVTESSSSWLNLGEGWLSLHLIRKQSTNPRRHFNPTVFLFENISINMTNYNFLLPITVMKATLHQSTTFEKTASRFEFTKGESKYFFTLIRSISMLLGSYNSKIYSKCVIQNCR